MRVTRHRAADVDRALYLRGLNTCFPGWGGEDRFAWCFARVLAGREPDLLLVNDGGMTIAGSAIVYRTIQCADGTRLRAGIIVGSWTLPEARGRGAFSCLLEESLVVAEDREAPLLIAFLAAANLSRGPVAAVASLMVPIYYCRLPVSQDVASLPSPTADASHFVYTDEEWRSQFIERPGVIERLSGSGWSAVLERADATDRVLHLDGDRDAALAALRKRGRELFFFATVAPVGFDITPGYFATFTARGTGSVWNIQNGDRM